MKDRAPTERISRRDAIARSLATVGAVAVSSRASAIEPQSNPASAHGEPIAMPPKTWTLTDVATRTYAESFRLSPEELPRMPGRWSIAKQTLRGGLADGVDVIDVQNGDFRFSVVPTRGLGVFEAWQGDFRLGWNSPVQGPVNPAFVHLSDPSGIGWLEGFDELLVRCGLEYNGGPEFNDNGTLRYPLHGKIANIPAQKVDVSVDPEHKRIAVGGAVNEGRLFGNKMRLTTAISTRLGHSEITIDDAVTNVSGEPGDLELIYHTNFGFPLLGDGAKIILPALRVGAYDLASLKHIDQWDLYGPDTLNIADACYFIDLAAAVDGSTMAVLRNAAGDRGICYRFNKNELPYFTLWKNMQSAADGYATGLEPGTNLPNAKSFEKKRGRVITMAPGETRRFRLTLESLTGREAVASAEKSVAELQQGRKPTIHDHLVPEWSDVK